jgi:hypothetical protein
VGIVDKNYLLIPGPSCFPDDVNTNLNSKIGYDGKQEEGFIAYADADWASDHISQKSVTGYIIKLAGGAVSWVS